MKCPCKWPTVELRVRRSASAREVSGPRVLVVKNPNCWAPSSSMHAAIFSVVLKPMTWGGFAPGAERGRAQEQHQLGVLSANVARMRNCCESQVSGFV